MTTDGPNGMVKLPMRIFEWLVLGALATGGGFVGSRSADETAAIADETTAIRTELGELEDGLRTSLQGFNRRLKRLEQQQIARRRRARRHGARSDTGAPP